MPNCRIVTAVPVRLMTCLCGSLVTVALTACTWPVQQAGAELAGDFGPAMVVMVLHDPGELTPQLSQRWGCSHQGVLELAEEFKEVGARVPTVGMNACVVLASFGAPYSVDRHESESGRIATWWYMDGGDMHYVSFTHVEDLAAYREQHWPYLGQCWDEVVKAHQELVIDKQLDSHWIVDQVIWDMSQARDRNEGPERGS